MYLYLFLLYPLVSYAMLTDTPPGESPFEPRSLDSKSSRVNADTIESIPIVQHWVQKMTSWLHTPKETDEPHQHGWVFHPSLPRLPRKHTVSSLQDPTHTVTELSLPRSIHPPQSSLSLPLQVPLIIWSRVIAPRLNFSLALQLATTNRHWYTSFDPTQFGAAGLLYADRFQKKEALIRYRRLLLSSAYLQQHGIVPRSSDEDPARMMMVLFIAEKYQWIQVIETLVQRILYPKTVTKMLFACMTNVNPSSYELKHYKKSLTRATTMQHVTLFNLILQHAISPDPFAFTLSVIYPPSQDFYQHDSIIQRNPFRSYQGRISLFTAYSFFRNTLLPYQFFMDMAASIPNLQDYIVLLLQHVDNMDPAHMEPLILHTLIHSRLRNRYDLVSAILSIHVDKSRELQRGVDAALIEYFRHIVRGVDPFVKKRKDRGDVILKMLLEQDAPQRVLIYFLHHHQEFRNLIQAANVELRMKEHYYLKQFYAKTFLSLLNQ